ncbi:MAG: hypothetical protein ACOYMP_04800 [Nodosilinea sp.]
MPNVLDFTCTDQVAGDQSGRLTPLCLWEGAYHLEVTLPTLAVHGDRTLRADTIAKKSPESWANVETKLADCGMLQSYTGYYPESRNI